MEFIMGFVLSLILFHIIKYDEIRINITHTHKTIEDENKIDLDALVKEAFENTGQVDPTQTEMDKIQDDIINAYSEVLNEFAGVEIDE